MWRHGDGCPSHTGYSRELRNEQVNAAAAGLAEALLSGDEDLWEQLALSVEFEPTGVMALALAIVVSRSPEAPGAGYL